MNYSIFLTVVVCTYNRSDLLAGCLESLCQQTIKKDKYEIILVDNNSTDNTSEIAKGFLDQSNFRYLLETSPGLSHARNRGLNEAKGEYVGYIDDDARAKYDWLETAINIINAHQGKIDCLGGPYYPFYTTKKPDWFKDDYEKRGFGEEERFLKENEYISGSNMIWKKEVLKLIGGFDPNTGIIGNRLRLGEETAAINALKYSGRRNTIYYSGKLIIYHWVPNNKMEVKYILKRRFAEGQYRGYRIKSIAGNNRFIEVRKATTELIKRFFRFLLDKKNYPLPQNWIVEAGGRVSRALGCLLALLGITPKVTQ